VTTCNAVACGLVQCSQMVNHPAAENVIPRHQTL